MVLAGVLSAAIISVFDLRDPRPGRFYTCQYVICPLGQTNVWVR